MTTGGDGVPSVGSAFWRFSLGFYRRPDVGPACIVLQDEAGVDVNVLLFLLWNASLGRRLSPSEVARVARESASWRDAVVAPLRNVRRALRNPPGLVAADAAAAYRTRIKAIELESERLQQEALFAVAGTLAFADRMADPAAAARANVVAFQACHDRPFPVAALNTILAAFDGFAASGPKPA